jgi:hypothetical protein
MSITIFIRKNSKSMDNTIIAAALNENSPLFLAINKNQEIEYLNVAILRSKIAAKNECNG